MIGWGTIGLSVTFADVSINLIVAPMNWLVDQNWIKRDGALTTLLYLLGATCIYGLFPLATAALAGWMSCRNRGSIGRSPTWAEGELAEEASPQHVPESSSLFDEETWPARES